MSLAEIGSRASYAAFLALERRRVRAGRRPAPLGSAHLRDARRAAAIRPRFFAGVESRDAMRALFATAGPYARQGEAARRAARDAAQNRFAFFGSRFAYGAEIDWHADPVTRREWPRVFHRDVPINDGGAAIGDVKYVWELNRHQFLIDLGKAYWLFGDAEAASAVYRIVRHWIAQNPYGVGVNWSCALEPAFRTWSWLWAYHFCDADPAFEDETRALWLNAMYEHGHFLCRHLEHYASPYNHLAGEASALYVLGLLFPWMPDAARWRRRGRRALERTLGSQFHADGGSVEQSTFYHHATLGFYLLAALLGEANGDPWGPADAAIERGIEFSMALMQPDGRLPSIGGADDGKCIRLEHAPFWDFRAYQAIGAVRYGRPDFCFAAGEFAEDALWLLGPSARERFLAMTPAPPAMAHALGASGYYVLRSDWSPSADYLLFDCGEQAAGLRRDEVPSAAHGHADCLSVILWLRGRPVLVDPGFHCYNGDPAWEVHFRRTAAHNTATVDGRDQSRHVHKMAWARVFQPRPEAWVPGARGGAAGGAHDGYLQTSGILHRRAVWLHDSGCGVICDQFTGSGSHEVEISFQFAPGAARLAGDSAVIFEDVELAWAATTAATASLRSGGPDPSDGWVAPSLGIRTPAPRLSLSLRFAGEPVTCLTVVFPREAAVAGARAARDERQSIARSSPASLAIGLQAGGAATDVELSIPPAVASARDLIGALTVARRSPAPAAAAPLLEQGCGR